jgi:hypothetical protein
MAARSKNDKADQDGGGDDPIPRALWERKEGESLQGYEAFVLYRSGTERKIPPIARALGLDLETVDKLAKRHQWKDRAAAWDAEVDRRLRDTEIDALAQMRQRQIQLGLGLQQAATLELRSLVRSIDAAEAKSNGGPRDCVLKPRELVQLLEAGVSLERVNRGVDNPETTLDDAPTMRPIRIWVPDNGRNPGKV